MKGGRKTKKSTKKSTNSLQALLNNKPSSATFGHLDIKSSSDVKKMMGHVGKVPIIVMFVYANWCGHCHRAMPIYKQSVATPKRGVLNVSVESEHLDEVSEALSKPGSPTIKDMVSGYPSMLIMDQTGQVSNMSASPENIKNATAGNVGTTNRGSKANNSKANNSKANSSKANNSKANSNATYANEAMTIPITTASKPVTIEPVTNSSDNEDQPMMDEEVEKTIEAVSASEGNGVVTRGGGLYASLASSAFNLAPAGVLMGLAAMRLGRKSRRSSKKRAKRTRKANRK